MLLSLSSNTERGGKRTDGRDMRARFNDRTFSQAGSLVRDGAIYTESPVKSIEK